MSIKDFKDAIVAALRPAGFVGFKSRREWRRERHGFLEEVDLQKARGRSEVTVNYALRHQEARLCVYDVAGFTASGLSFPISGRIGKFVGPMDLWWRDDDPAGPRAVQELIQTRLLPYFGRMETVGPYIEELTKYCPPWSRWGTVTHRLELAVLLHKTGDTEGARRLLTDPPDKVGPEQLARVAAVYRHLFEVDPPVSRPA
jgi:hypothetical protein